jgi:dTMP kinase
MADEVLQALEQAEAQARERRLAAATEAEERISAAVETARRIQADGDRRVAEALDRLRAEQGRAAEAEVAALEAEAAGLAAADTKTADDPALRAAAERILAAVLLEGG